MYIFTKKPISYLLVFLDHDVILSFYFTITEILRTTIQLPPEQSIEDSPEVCEMSNKLQPIDDLTAGCVREKMHYFNHDQRTVLRKLNDNEGITRISDNIKILIDTASDLGKIGTKWYKLVIGYNVLCIHANESNFDWFKNEFGDGGRWLIRSYDNIKYLTTFNAGRLIAHRSLEPLAAKRDVSGCAEQVKATDQQLDSATGGVLGWTNVEKEDSQASIISQEASNREISSTTISSTTPWHDQH